MWLEFRFAYTLSLTSFPKAAHNGHGLDAPAGALAGFLIRHFRTLNSTDEQLIP